MIAQSLMPQDSMELMDHYTVIELSITLAVVRMYLACRRVKAIQDQRKAEMQKGTQY